MGHPKQRKVKLQYMYTRANFFVFNWQSHSVNLNHMTGSFIGPIGNDKSSSLPKITAKVHTIHLQLNKYLKWIALEDQPSIF